MLALTLFMYIFKKIFFLIQHQLFDFTLFFIEILLEALLCVFVMKGVCVFLGVPGPWYVGAVWSL